MIGTYGLENILRDVLARTGATYAAILGEHDTPLVSCGKTPIEPRVLQAIASVIAAGGVSMQPGPAQGCAVLSGQERSIVTCRIDSGHHLIFIYDGPKPTSNLLEDIAAGLETSFEQRFGSGAVHA